MDFLRKSVAPCGQGALHGPLGKVLERRLGGTNSNRRRYIANRMSNADLLWCGDVLHRLRCHKDAFPFQMPVDPSLKEYHKIIKKPMDLMTLGRHLHSGRYPDRIAFCEQVRLIFANCRTFNVASSEFCKMGNRLERFFDTILKKEEKKNPTSTTSVDEGSLKKKGSRARGGGGGKPSTNSSKQSPRTSGRKRKGVAGKGPVKKK